MFDDAVAILKPQIVKVGVDELKTKKTHLEIATQERKGMLTVRAESEPPVHVLGRKIVVYTVLDVSIFPGISYSLVIQLASDMYQLLYHYLMMEPTTEAASEELLFGSNHMKAMGKKVKKRNATRVRTNSRDTDHDSDTEDVEVSIQRRDMCYFKYIRVGKICLRINCNGFVVNLRKFDLDLPSFVRRKKLWTWKKFMQKFEKHL